MIEDIARLLMDDNHKQPFLMLGKVIENYNPLHPASVKVSLKGRAAGMGITAWAKVTMVDASSGKGIYSLPNVGDEVVVAFLDGEIDVPIVIGSLYSATALPPSEALLPTNNVKMIKTQAGNTIKIDDLSGIEIKSVTKQTVLLNDKNLEITISDSTNQTSVKISKGNVEINALSGVSLKVGASEIKIDNKAITIKSPQVNVEAMQALNLKGMQVTEKGQMVSIAADAQLDIKSSGIANVKGAMLKLN